MARQYAIHSLPTPFFINDNGNNQGVFFTTFVDETGGANMQFLIGGPGLEELFVTSGRVSAMGISYAFNPLSRRTV